MADELEFYLAPAFHLSMVPEPLSVRDIERLADELDHVEWLWDNKWELPGADGLSETAADDYAEKFLDQLFAAKHAYADALERAMWDELARQRAAKNFCPSIPDFFKSGDLISATLAMVESKEFRLMSHRARIEAEAGYERAWRFHNAAFLRWEANMAKQAETRAAGKGISKPRRVKATPTKYVRGPNGTRIPRSKLR
jgi:hypothetical protein